MEHAGRSIGHSLALVRRHAWLVVILALVSAGGAYLLASRDTPMYAATAQLLYSPGLDLSNPLGSYAYVDANTQQIQILGATTTITSPEIGGLVRSALGSASPWPSYSVQATVSTPSQSGAAATYSTGVMVTATSPSAQWAAKLANAYSLQFIKWRTKNEQNQIASAMAVLTTKVKDLEARGQRSSSDYAILTGDLQDLEIRSATATGDFVVVVPATVPSAPYAPKPRKAAVLGLGVGIIVGLGVALLRERLDTRLRSHREIAESLGLPIVGRIPTITNDVLTKGPLVVLTEPDGAAANAMRILHTNIEFAKLGEERRVLMVMSALQGEGKSVTIANLAASLALAGNDVLLVDGDLRRPQMHRLFGLRNAGGISSVIAGQVELEDAIQFASLPAAKVHTLSNASGARSGVSDGTTLGLRVLTAGPPPPNPGEMVASQRFASVIAELKSMPCDLLLLDSPAFLAVGDSLALSADVDGVLLVVDLARTRKPVLEEAREFLSAVPAPTLGVITVRDDLGRDEQYRRYSQQ